ncbi:unnamed protein product [Lupinus luteus]|uniref:Uncharacterized protein n=1 Tax=Lupinus luteus TaxID=3873 RepID=A0AAV1WN88_LUPLU
MVSNCRKRPKETHKIVPMPKKKHVIEKDVHKNNEKDFVINMEIDHSEEVDLHNVTRVKDTPSTSPVDGSNAEVLVDIDANMVDDPVNDLVPNDNTGEDNILVDIELNEAMEVQVVEEIHNPIADDDVDEEVNDECRFTTILTRGLGNHKTQLVLNKLCKSHKPMIDKDGIHHWFWSSLHLKFFFVNDRGPLIPSIWGLCKLDLDPILLFNTYQQVSVVVSVYGKDMFLAVVYGSPNQRLKRFLWEELKGLVLAN